MYGTLIYRFKEKRWAFIKFIIDLLGCDAELNREITKFRSWDRRMGEWNGLDKAINLLNTYEKNMIDKKELYNDLMRLRPE